MRAREVFNPDVEAAPQPREVIPEDEVGDDRACGIALLVEALREDGDIDWKGRD